MSQFFSTAQCRRYLPWLALFAVSVAHAEYFWIDNDADSLRIRYGELAKPQSVPADVQGTQATAADGKAVALDAVDGSYKAAQAGGDLRFTANHANEKALVIYHARFGRQETKASSDLELVPTTPGGNNFRLFWKGSPVAASQVNVVTSEGWLQVLRPATDGSVSFNPSFPALYVLEVSAKVNGAVTVDGKKYDDVRHTATLSFRVDR